MNRTFLWIAVPALGVAALGFLNGCHSSSSANPPQATAPPVRVTAAKPVRKTLRLESVQPGQIEAFEQTPLFVKLPAYVEKLYVDIGDRVEQGKPVADLSIPELHDEAHQKEAMLVHAKAGVQQATAAVRAAEKAVVTAEAGLREARAGTIRALGQYERWKSEHARIVELEASRSVDRRLVDETQNELSAAEAARGEAEAKVASAEAALVERTVGVEKAQADLTVAQAAVGNAEADLAHTNSLLNYTHVRMPYTGIVVQRNVDRGDFVQPASMATAKPLFIVARSDTVRIFVDVPEMEAPRIELGAIASVHVQALPNQKIEGTVTRTSWALGANRTLRTELDIPNPHGVLRPGMYATAEIVLQQRPNVLALPLAAVVTVDKQALCCCVENDKIVRRPITLGLRTAQEVEVTEGLQGEELVVQAQVGSLQQGQAVDVAGAGS
ncbi:MAG: efflux RND transporter periplasmic adaptor subunit [Thermoguttaceae bacterium]